MRKLKDALRLKLVGGQSHQQIASALGIAKGSVTKYCALAATAGLDWSAIEAMSETDLEHRLFGASLVANYARPDYGRMHQELRRKGVTVMLPLSIVLASVAIRRRDVAKHQDWMRRAYAIGIGAGTQALTSAARHFNAENRNRNRDGWRLVGEREVPFVR